MKTIKQTLTCVVASLAFGACGGLDDTGTPPDDQPPPTDPGDTSGGEDNTFDHDNSGINFFDVIARLERVGPPKFTSRVHGAVKMRYATLGNVLTSLGVDINNQTPLSAGQLYQDGSIAMGSPNYGSRIRENLDTTTSGTSRMFDIFAAAADEVIAFVPTSPRCPGAVLFDASDNCVASGISCIIGTQAQQAHVDFCTITVHSPQAADVATGKRIAVAALLAAANTIE